MLGTDLQEGALLTELHDVFKKVKKPVGVRCAITTPPEEVGPKRLKTIREISKQYTGLIDMLAAQMQALNEEIRFTEGRCDGECSLLTASKGIVGALTAIAPVLDTVLQRGSVDPELNAQVIHLANAIKLLVRTHSQMRWDRKQSMNKVVHTTRKGAPYR